eukprot:6207948-Pleurochrysis_carterae.AAC.2
MRPRCGRDVGSCARDESVRRRPSRCGQDRMRKEEFLTRWSNAGGTESRSTGDTDKIVIWCGGVKRGEEHDKCKRTHHVLASTLELS